MVPPATLRCDRLGRLASTLGGAAKSRERRGPAFGRAEPSDEALGAARPAAGAAALGAGVAVAIDVLLFPDR